MQIVHLNSTEPARRLLSTLAVVTLVLSAPVHTQIVRGTVLDAVTR